MNKYKEREFSMERRPDRKLILESGEEYLGYGFGAPADGRVLELVFNTSMTGYQEIMSDPSYKYQAVVMSYPLIGNYGMNNEDYESDIPAIGAFIVREYNDRPSNFRSVESLGSVMKRYGIPGIEGIDTRRLVRSVRDKGNRKALIANCDTPLEKGLEILKETDIPRDAVSRVSKRAVKIYLADKERYRVAAIDCGMKKNILRSLNDRGVTVIAVPWNTRAEDIMELYPDGIFISNGPGDPEDVRETVETVGKLIGTCPIFGICLGNQIIALAYGAKTYKLKFGHRGGNHPVLNLETGKIEITSQNHSYAVDPKSLEKTPLAITHVNLLDNTVEGVKCEGDRVFGVQYHPESAPGPLDSGYLFDSFIKLMEEERKNA